MKQINAIGIIDDDPITVFGIRKMLRSIDVCNDIRTFENGKEAIDHIKQLLAEDLPVPEVIFLDINMPIMDGWQFLEEFITLPLKTKIRINIVTSSINQFDRQQWEFYKKSTEHLIDFRNKPLRKSEIAAITKAA